MAIDDNRTDTILRELVTLTKTSTQTVKEQLKEIEREIDDMRNVLNGTDGKPGFVARTYILEQNVLRLEKANENDRTWRWGLAASIIVALITATINMALHFVK